MTNAYTSLLNALSSEGATPRKCMVQYGARLDWFSRTIGGEEVTASASARDNSAVFHIQCRSPYIDTDSGLDALYGIVGCDKIAISPINNDDGSVQINVHVKDIIKEAADE